MPALALRPLSGGEILDASFQIYRQHFRPLVLLGLIAFAPVAVAYVLTGVPPGAGDTGDPAITFAVLDVVLFGFTLLTFCGASVALMHAVDRIARGEEVDITRGLAVGVRRLPSLLLLYVITYLLLGLATIPIVGVAFAGLAAGAAGELEGAARVALLVVLIAAAFAGLSALLIWAAGWLFIAPCALVLEGIGPIAALRRGRDLAKGARIRILGLGSLAWTIATLPSIGVVFLLGMGSTLWNPDAAAALSGTELLVQEFASAGVGALTMAFTAAVSVMLYLDCRVRVEGYDVELASAAIPVTA